jgi:peptidoglycan/xylan/chitin deacetylase (PgdA/CDA1 family)
MRVPGVKRLRMSARWLRSRLLNSGLILGYHRISDSSADPFSLCVTPEHFAEQLGLIRKHGRPMSLTDLVQALRNGKVPRRAVVVTFDDGYSDNLHVAKPLLEHYEVPATVFITSGHLGREFWWDQLDWTLSTSASLPEQLSLKIGGTVHRLEADWTGRHRLENSAAAWRQRSMMWLYGLLQPLAEGERQQVMEQLQAWPGATTQDVSDRKLLSPDEVLRLGQGTLIEIGAHTVSHPNLARLPILEQETEIRQCKNYLEELLNRPVNSFAYPHGLFSDATVTAVRDAGYVCACTSSNDVIWSRSNCYQLPRFWPTDCNGESFARWLGRWLND